MMMEGMNPCLIMMIAVMMIAWQHVKELKNKQSFQFFVHPALPTKQLSLHHISTGEFSPILSS